MLGHLSGQYRATLAPILFNPAGCSQIMGFFLGGAYFCGLWETCNSFFFFNAKPFIALGDVKSTGCLQQCHATKGLSTGSIWDTAEPGPHPVSVHPLSTSPAATRSQTGQQPVEPFTSLSACGSQVSITNQVFFSSRELLFDAVYSSIRKHLKSV